MKVHSTTGDTLEDTRTYSGSPTVQEESPTDLEDAWPEHVDVESRELANDVEGDKQKEGKKRFSCYTFMSIKNN